VIIRLSVLSESSLKVNLIILVAYVPLNKVIGGLCEGGTHPKTFILKVFQIPKKKTSHRFFGVLDRKIVVKCTFIFTCHVLIVTFL